MTSENVSMILPNDTTAPVLSKPKSIPSLPPGVVIPDTMIPADVLENKCDEVGNFWSVEKPLNERSLRLLERLNKIYTSDLLEQLIVPRSLKTLGITREYDHDEKSLESNGLSLRCLEWLVTNYAKKYSIVLYNKNTKRRFSIYTEYMRQLDHNRRLRFDPFCRHKRIYFYWDLEDVSTKKTNKVVLLTTVGQLNFMHWAHENGVLKYAQENQEKIQKDMESTLSAVTKEKKHFKKIGQKRKRKELSKAPDTYCNVYSVDTLLYFDHQFDDPISPKHNRKLSPVSSPKRLKR